MLSKEPTDFLVLRLPYHSEVDPSARSSSDQPLTESGTAWQKIGGLVCFSDNEVAGFRLSPYFVGHDRSAPVMRNMLP